MPSSPDVRISGLRKRLETVRNALLRFSADSIENSIPALTQVAEELAALSREVAGHPPYPGPQRDKLLREVRHLRADLSRLEALASQGLEFCRKWSHVIQSAAGYLPSGKVAPVGESATILVRG